MLNGINRSSLNFVAPGVDPPKPKAAAPLPERDRLIVDAVFDIIINVYGARRDCYTRLAKDGHVTKRTAHHWISRSHAPRVVQLFSLIRANPAIRTSILALIARMTETSPAK